MAADTSMLTNVDFSFRRGSKQNMNLTPLKNGSLNICMDTDEFFADIDDRRIPLSGIVIYESYSDIEALTNPEPVIYYAINTNTLYHFNPVDLEWTRLTDGTADPSVTEFVIRAEAGDHAIIFHQANGSTFMVATDDLDTTYSTGTPNEEGLTKLYTTTGTNSDGTINQQAISELLNGRVSVEDGTAPKATSDAAGQNINSTYIKNVSVSGRVVTFTKGNNSTFSITTQDTNDNTTYSTGNSTYSGLTKLYPSTGSAIDGTMTQASIKTALDGKLSTAGTANAAIEDGRRQNIAATYIKNVSQNSVNGHRITFTWGDDQTTTIEIPDEDHIYSEATANTLGLVKLYSGRGTAQDGTITQAGLSRLLDDKLDTTGKAAAAVNDDKGQQIDATYIKNATVSGRIVTFSRGDGSTFTIETAIIDPVDVRRAIGVGTPSEVGLTKLYNITGRNTDGTINQDTLTTLLNNKLATSATAVKATGDASGQNISQTYIKNAQVSGQTITFTKGDNSTFTVTTQDNNTTYAQAVVDSGQEGLVKLYSVLGTNTDGAVTQNRVNTEINSVKNNSITNSDYSTQSNRLTFQKGDGSTYFHTINDTTYSTGTTTYSGLTQLYTSTGTSEYGTIRQKELSTILNGKLGADQTAQAATRDGSNQVISETYIKAVNANGTTVTFTRGDGSTFSIQTQDEDHVYDNATSAVSGVMKLYSTTGANTDGTMSQNAITNYMASASVNKAKYDFSNNQIDGYINKIEQPLTDLGKLNITHGNGSTQQITMHDSRVIEDVFSTTAIGLVPAPGSGTNANRFLRGTGWSVLPTLNTTQSGIVTAPSSGQAGNGYYLAGTGEWVPFTRTAAMGTALTDLDLVDDSSNIIITRKNGSTYTVNLSDYGSEDSDELTDLTSGGTASTYTYNGSTYTYRVGQVYRNSNNELVPITVTNNSTFSKTIADDEDEVAVTYNSTDTYINRIK